MKKVMAVVLVTAMLLSGCAGASVDLTQGYIPRAVADAIVLPDQDPVNFAVSLFRNSVTEGENVLISPLSVLSALAMTANGAQGETLTQMETVLGATREELNGWVYTYMEALEEKDALHLANGIWFNTNERFEPGQAFLQTNADYFDAGIYGAPFDGATLRDINSWVKNHTGGMIENVLDQIPDDAVMYLVNALAFEARWANVYEEDQVQAGVFTTGDGVEQEVELMYDTGSHYLETENAAGFIRYYEGNDYAFAALLPKEGTTVSQLVDGLDGASLAALLAAPQNVAVQTAIPKFEAETTLNMAEILQAMGMTDAFDAALADFSGLGTSDAGNICIDRVIHKTFVSVAEQGTRAGAATVVEANDRSMSMEDANTVYLNRPFVYMLVDCENNLPFFMGTCMEIGN